MNARGDRQVWRVWLRPNATPLLGYCELCGLLTIAPVPSAFFYENDDSAFPVCVACAVNYGARIPHEEEGAALW